MPHAGEKKGGPPLAAALMAPSPGAKPQGWAGTRARAARWRRSVLTATAHRDEAHHGEAGDEHGGGGGFGDGGGVKLPIVV